ncbi:DUF4825 domain-containing protein [Oceanobacillus chungangensis]|uniref:DUF4825 domain-containing protein n=1 Tax=Oceanobacillus chungangensis TaxID=1229152 RepID=A0A3D8PPB2_9BACI|nr:DUF4825 domain-containing protein [Oceanobacillus chungangensis]RDW17088.1 DUF4825 domain-containing protein [Oceanobacillus chungangensis]
MWRMTKISMLPLLILLILNGCNAINANDNDIFQYKDSYVGDNSAVGNIVSQLPEGKHLNGFELKTNEEPYGIILNYQGIATGDYKKIAINNATFIFTLIHNVEWVTFNFNNEDNEEYNVTKEKLQKWYEKDLSEFTNVDDLNSFIQEYLQDDSKVNQYFEQ